MGRVRLFLVSELVFSKDPFDVMSMVFSVPVSGNVCVRAVSFFAFGRF